MRFKQHQYTGDTGDMWSVALLLLLLAGTARAQIPKARVEDSAHTQALEQYGKKNYPAAAELFRRAMETETPGSAAHRESTTLLGESLYLAGKTAEAIPVLARAPRTNEVLYMLGNSYLKTRDAEKSVATFAEMYGVNAASAGAHLIAAQMMLRLELTDDAEKQLDRAVELEPRIPQAHFLLGEIFSFKGMDQKAIENFRREIEINPDSAMAYYRLGGAYAKQGNWDTAVSLLQKSVWLNSANSGPYILLGKGYLQLKQLTNAEGMLRQAVQMDPRNSSAHYLLGQTLMQEGKTVEGRAMLDLSQKLKR